MDSVNVGGGGATQGVTPVIQESVLLFYMYAILPIPQRKYKIVYYLYRYLCVTSYVNGFYCVPRISFYPKSEEPLV